MQTSNKNHGSCYPWTCSLWNRNQGKVIFAHYIIKEQIWLNLKLVKLTIYNATYNAIRSQGQQNGLLDEMNWGIQDPDDQPLIRVVKFFSAGMPPGHEYAESSFLRSGLFVTSCSSSAACTITFTFEILAFVSIWWAQLINTCALIPSIIKSLRLTVCGT